MIDPQKIRKKGYFLECQCQVDKEQLISRQLTKIRVIREQDPNSQLRKCVCKMGPVGKPVEHFSISEGREGPVTGLPPRPSGQRGF